MSGSRSTRSTTLILAALLAGCDAEPQARAADRATPLPAAPEIARTTGLDSAAVADVYATAERLPRLHSLLVARDGELLHERYFRGRNAAGRANVKSVSKSWISALVGIAIAEGKLRPDQPIAPFFAQHLAAEADPRKRTITVGHLLSMQSGLEPTSFGNYGSWVTSRNWVRYVLTRPMVDDPGGRMLYSTGSTHLLSAILTRATGMSTHAYARDRIARPLGIDLRPWATDPQGIYFGGNEMRMTPREMLRFGEMYRNGGRWEGRQVVPEEWVRESWRPRTVSRFNGHHYGYGWWSRPSGAHEVLFAWGYGGQYIFIVPDLALTVVATSDSESARSGDHLREVHALLDRLVMAAERGEVR